MLRFTSTATLNPRVLGGGGSLAPLLTKIPPRCMILTPSEIMRTPKVANISNVHVTQLALQRINLANQLRRGNLTFREIAREMNTSERNARRYYWGIHSLNHFPETSREQIRIGACVPI